MSSDSLIRLSPDCVGIYSCRSRGSLVSQNCCYRCNSLTDCKHYAGTGMPQVVKSNWRKAGFEVGRRHGTATRLYAGPLHIPFGKPRAAPYIIKMQDENVVKLAFNGTVCPEIARATLRYPD